MDMLPVAILAGGLATRLRPLTETIPKALIEIAGKPFIDHQLAYLRRQQITRVVLCVGFLGEMIEEHVQNGSAFGLQVTYSYDGPQLLGTGGSLKQALPLLGNAFFVLYGDSYLPCDFQAVQRAFELAHKPALMTVFKNNGQWDTSNVALSTDGLSIYYNKFSIRPDMHHIDYGLSILTPAPLLQRYNENIFDFAAILHELSTCSELAPHEVFGRFYEIGSLNGINELETLFKKSSGAFCGY